MASGGPIVKRTFSSPLRARSRPSQLESEHPTGQWIIYPFPDADASLKETEGLGSPKNMHPMQAAFVKHDGYQCGFCTPGQICSAVAMLEEVKAGVPSHVTTNLTARPEATLVEFRERMSGNICRCGAYSNIQQAIAEVAGVKA